MITLHKACYSSKIIPKWFNSPNIKGYLLFCKHCDQFIEPQDIINIDTPFWNCISIIKSDKHARLNTSLAELIINAIGKIKEKICKKNLKQKGG